MCLCTAGIITDAAQQVSVCNTGCGEDDIAVGHLFALVDFFEIVDPHRHGPVQLEAIGGNGLRELASSCLACTEELKRRLTAVGEPWRLTYPSSPTFNEFLLTGPGSGTELVQRLASEGVLAGVPTTGWGGSWPDGVLVAVTERNSVSDIEALVQALEKLS